MALAQSPYPAHEFPPELVRAVADEAARDADQVIGFLGAIGLPAPATLPGDLLLGLGAALRLFRWELCGLRAHLDAGLPAARQALDCVFRAHAPGADAERAQTGRDLAFRVMVLFAERFSWCAREELDADVTLGPADEDALLHALADILMPPPRA